MKTPAGSGFRGRGTALNPANRFESLSYERDSWSPEDPAPSTQFFQDKTRTIITYNDSPDVGFNASVNAYRGCEHGCVYCFARPNHEYLGFSAGLDFETRILVKEDAPELLRRELAHARWIPQPIALSGVTDPYQPIERRRQLTRRCLQVLAECRNPAVIITKSNLIERDQDLLASMAEWKGCLVFISITTLEPEVAHRMEPRAATPARRLGAIETLAGHGIPVGVLAAPMVPGLTDHEIPSILKSAADAGAICAGYITLRLPYGLNQLFEDWLSTHAPERKAKVMRRLRSIRGGRKNDANFQTRMTGEGPYAKEMRDLFELGRRRSGLTDARPMLDASSFVRPSEPQGRLFDS